MLNLTETDLETVKMHIIEQNFSQYVYGITEQPSEALVNEFSEYFDDIELGTPLLALEETYKFLLTENYLLWWDDCVEYNYEPIENVLVYHDCMYDTVAVSKKREDTYMGDIVHGEDVNEDMQEGLAGAIQETVEFILAVKNK